MHPMLELAAKVAVKRKDKRAFLLGAVGVRKDNALVHARNEGSAEPTPTGHAEVRLCRKLGLDSPVVYIARYSKGKNGFAMAKPCSNCLAVLKAHRVKVIVFTTGPDSFERVILND